MTWYEVRQEANSKNSVVKHKGTKPVDFPNLPSDKRGQSSKSSKSSKSKKEGQRKVKPAGGEHIDLDQLAAGSYERPAYQMENPYADPFNGERMEGDARSVFSQEERRQ